MIVECAAYEGGCRIADVGLDQLREWTERAGAFVWVDLFEPSEEELRTVQGQLGLHDLAIEDARQAHQRPKLDEYGDDLFLVLRTARWDEEKRRVERGETHVFVGPRYVASIGHGDTVSYSAVRTRCQATPRRPGTPGGCLSRTLPGNDASRHLPEPRQSRRTSVGQPKRCVDRR
jgi:magnesium transporter